MGNVTYGSFSSEDEMLAAAGLAARCRTADPAKILEAAKGYAAPRGLTVVDKTAEVAGSASGTLSSVRAAPGTLAFVARAPETEAPFAREDPPAEASPLPNVRVIRPPFVALLVGAGGQTLLVPSLEAFTQAAFDSLL